MAANNPEHHVARQLRMIEWLKAELVTALGQLFKALADNRAEAIRAALAYLVIGCFLLGKRLGIPFAKLDETITATLQSPELHAHEIEKWHGDISNLQNYWEERTKP